MRNLLKKCFVLSSIFISFLFPNYSFADSKPLTGFKPPYLLNTSSEKNSFSDKRIAQYFRKSLTERILEHREILMPYDPLEDQNNSDPNYEDKSDSLTRIVVGSVGDTFKQTKIGKKVERIRERISRYFVLGYWKNVEDQQAKLYLPGDASAKKRKEEKVYGISLGSSIYPSPNALKEDFALKIKGNYHESEINTFYNLVKNKIRINVSNKKLNSFLKIDLNLYTTMEQNEKVYGTLFSIKF